MNHLIYPITLAFLFVSLGVAAQNEERTIYTDSVGNIYVRPNSPLRLFIGTKIDGSNAVEMHSMNGKKQALIWNGSGLKSLKHVDLYLGRSINFILHADGIAPTSAMKINAFKKSPTSDTIYIKSGAVIELNASDKGSGVQSIMYSINSETPKQYNQPIILDSEGKYNLSVYAVDNLGNKEDQVTRNFIVDNTPPTTALSIEGDQFENIVSGRSRIVLTTTDSYGIEQTSYQIDSTKKMKYVNPIKTARLTEGEHSITWFSTDRVGNIEAVQSYSFFVDKTPPLVFEEVIGNTYMIGNKEFSSGRSQLKIAAVDNKSGIKEIFYSLNGKEFTQYDKSVTLSEIMGTIKVNSYAVDKVNNRSQSGTSTETFNMPIIDITGPRLSYKLIGTKIVVRDTTWISPTTKIQIQASDREAGVNRIIIRINNSDETTYTQPFAIENGGFYDLKCTAFDHVENLNFLNFKLGVDSSAPELFTHFSVKSHSSIEVDGETIPIYYSDVKLFLAATDNLSGNVSISYSINGNKPLIYSGQVQVFTPEKLNTISITATDKLGNSTSQTLKFWISK